MDGFKRSKLAERCEECFINNTYERLYNIIDSRSFEEWDSDLRELPFNVERDYLEKLEKARKETNAYDAILCGKGKINGQVLAIGIMDTKFMKASMGFIVGEKICRLFERAIKLRLPVLLICCSGGARMQEGIFSLMQMEKTAAIVKKHSRAGLLYISLLTNPTSGGVLASFSTLADIILAEPDSFIGFTGPRVMEQIIGKKMPDSFQKAEFQMNHGQIDYIVDIKNEKKVISKILRLHGAKRKMTIHRNKAGNVHGNIDIQMPETKLNKVKIARSQKRPTSEDYIQYLFPDFLESHGDRLYGDDPAIICGIASLDGIPITVVGIQKGKKSMQDAVYRNFGMPMPEGYRKSLRLMKQAEKFRRPIICLIDTSGAYCGEEAEKHGQSSAIARNLYDMSDISVPILSVIVGEGESGGALALGVANEVWMLENSIYSIISPEGYASIVWKNAEMVNKAINKLKFSAKELYDLKIVDKIIREDTPIEIESMTNVCECLYEEFVRFIYTYQRKSHRNIKLERYKKFRNF